MKLYHAYVEGCLAEFRILNVEKMTESFVYTDEPRFHKQGNMDVSKFQTKSLPNPMQGHFITESPSGSYMLIKEYIGEQLIPSLENQLETARLTYLDMNPDKCHWRK